jgi:hypothetical protein
LFVASKPDNCALIQSLAAEKLHCQKEVIDMKHKLEMEAGLREQIEKDLVAASSERETQIEEVISLNSSINIFEYFCGQTTTS